MNLHELCLENLNAEITQALVCGKRFKPSALKDLIITFGALHLFVVSGAHLHFWNEGLKCLNFPKKWRRIGLALVLLSCDFSAPIMRAFTQLEIRFQKSIHTPKTLTPFLALLACSPLAYYKAELFSLSLSFVFASLIPLCVKKNLSEQAVIAALALPIFIGALGIPHHSSILIVPLLALTLIILMPLSFLSLFSNYIEYTVASSWWKVEQSFYALHTFYSHPKKPEAFFEASNLATIFLYGLILSLIIYFLGVLWNRKSFSLYYS